MLDVVDFTTNPAAAELGRFGTLTVRYRPEGRRTGS